MSTCDLAARLLGKDAVDIWDRSLAAFRSDDSRDDRMSSTPGLLDLFLLVVDMVELLIDCMCC